MVQRLSDRLECIFRYVPQGAKVVDVGTDHALLPVALVERGVASHMIASDIVEGPLAAARNHVKEAALLHKIELRLGPGLSTVEPGEVDTAIIAGMGGATVAEILGTSCEVTRSLQTLVLQPMNAPGRLRDALRALRFVIVDEQYVKDKERVYQLIVANPDKDGSLSQAQYDPFVQKGLLWLALEFGPLNLSRGGALVVESLESEAAHLRSILDSISGGGHARTDTRRGELLQKLNQIDKWLGSGNLTDKG